MRAVLACTLVVAACGSPPPSPEVPRPLVLERASPPQFTSREAFVAARDRVVVLGSRVSRDGGASWEPVAPAIAPLERVAIDGAVLALWARSAGLARYDLATRSLTPVPGAPSYAGERTWRVTPAGRFVVFDGIRNAIAFEEPAGWRTTTLPQPSPTERDPYVTDVESNGAVVLAVSAWGVFREDAGAWTLVMPRRGDAGRDLVALRDGGFVLLGGATTYRFDARGEPTDEAPGLAVELGETVVCDDGAVLARGSISRDGGRTWASLLGGGDLALTVVRIGCGGGYYWLVGYSDAWGYRVLRYDATTRIADAIGNWELAGEPAWNASGPPLARTADGTFLAAGLAWREGDAGWTLREIPARTWAAGETLFGIAGGQFYTSPDAGRTWRGTAAEGLTDAEIEAFARTADGALYVSHFAGAREGETDRWEARVWRSRDAGATWAIAYEGRASRTAGGELEGEVHRFIGITAEGTWVATDAVSLDGGATWTATDAVGQRSLAFLTPAGHLVTTLPAGSAREDVWRVYEQGGRGALVASWAVEADGELVPASQLRSVVFDDAGHAYVARGAPYVQLWRTTEPVTEPRE